MSAKKKTINIAPSATGSNLSKAEEEKLLNWLSDGIDIDAAAALFQKEFNRELDKNEVVKLWSANSRQLHLARRNYFAQIASAIVENKYQGESALDAATAYLLKQTLFEVLISPERDARTIEILTKALKMISNRQGVAGSTDQNGAERTNEISAEKLKEIEQIINIL
ncbi:MAG: hypothetical protein ACP5T0_11755 [Verrucomicrobiia bacterium]